MFSHLVSVFSLDFSRQAREIHDIFPAVFGASGLTQMEL